MSSFYSSCGTSTTLEGLLQVNRKETFLFLFQALSEVMDRSRAQMLRL